MKEKIDAVIGQHATYFDTGLWSFIKGGHLVAPDDLTTAQLKDHLRASGGAVYLRENGQLAWLNIARWNRGGEELPFTTYQRLTGEKWPGGRSEKITDLLEHFGIAWPAGSAEANLCLQGALLAQGKKRGER